MPIRPSDLSGFLVFGFWFLVSGFWCSRYLTKNPILETRNSIPETKNQKLKIRNLAFLLLLLLCVPAVQAQDRPPPLPTPPDTSAVNVPPDSAVTVPPVQAPMMPPRDAAPQAASPSGLDKPVQFQATDSLIIRFDDEEGDQGRLLGNATVTYGEAKLEAYTIDILFDKEELRAEGLPSDTGLVGAPLFTQAAETFAGTSFAYNMGTERGRVVGARTQFEEGFIRAGVAKVREDSTIFIRDGLYTTCNCGPEETPSYSLRSNKMKVVDQKWVYTGPIQLFIYNIPTPIWLPFGFLPYQEGRRSGILAPEYGEDQRGFYLRNWGYYWAINDYTDLQVRLGLWTKGSWQINPSFRYNKRDRYNGGISVDFIHTQSGEKGDPDQILRNEISLRWSHNQTLNPTARITGNVNLTNSSYLQTVSNNYNDNVTQTVGSSIQYNKRWQSGRSLSLNLRQSQVLSTGSADLTLPELSFSQSTKTPFKRETGGSGRDQRWFERIQYSYNGRMSNRYSFQPLTDDQLIMRGDTTADGTPIDVAWYEALFDQEKYEQATGQDNNRINFRATHRVPISAPFTVNRLPLLGTFRLNLSPNFNYTEEWYLETERQQIDTTGVTQRDPQTGFFALRQFNTGVSAQTTFYGIFPVKAGAYQGVRHTVRPSLGFSFKPDFSSDFWGYSRDVLDAMGNPVVDTLSTGEVETRRYNIVSGVQGGLQQSLSFGIDNTFETKRVTADSTGEEQSRVLKLFNVNFRSSYNFAADSLQLAPIQISARTNVLGKLNLNFSSTLSPYALNEEGNRVINEYVFSLKDFKFGRLTQMSIRGDFRMSSRRGGGSQGFGNRGFGQTQQPGIQSFSNNTTSSLGLNDPFSTSPFGSFGTTGYGEQGAFSDWSLNVSFTYRITKQFSTLNRTATLNTGFDFNVTPTWKVRGQTGYDFENKEIVTTTLNILKDFECWEMALNWVPFGRFQSWGFDLHVKSGKLREFLRLRQPKQNRDLGFGR